LVPSKKSKCILGCKITHCDDLPETEPARDASNERKGGVAMEEKISPFHM